MSITGSNTASNALKSQEPDADEPSMNEILASIKQIIAEDEAAEISLQDREQYQHPSEHSNSNLATDLSPAPDDLPVAEILGVDTSVIEEDVEESLIAGLEAAMEEVLQVNGEVARADAGLAPNESRMDPTVLDSDIADILDLEAKSSPAPVSEPVEEFSIAANLAKISPVHASESQRREVDDENIGSTNDAESEMTLPEPFSVGEPQAVSVAVLAEPSTDIVEKVSETAVSSDAKQSSEVSVFPHEDEETNSADKFADELSKVVEIIAADEGARPSSPYQSPSKPPELSLPQEASPSQSSAPLPLSLQSPQSPQSPQAQADGAQYDQVDEDNQKVAKAPILSPGVEAVPSLHQRAEKVRQEFSSVASGLSADERLANYRVRNNPDLPSLRFQKQEEVAKPADPEPVVQQVIAEPQPAPAMTPAPAPEPSPPDPFAIAEVVAKSLMDEKEAEFEQMVANIVRPTIRKWLSENLPGLVEKLVREEIETVSRGKRAS
ncbi:MAG: DUF2497 domain-containing protein [Rhizobiaceae bacterium]